MDDNNYEWQQIFINLFAATIVDKLDANKGFWLTTGSTTTQETYTDIENAKAGVAYCIECGDKTHLPKIAKSGKFANITAAFNAFEYLSPNLNMWPTSIPFASFKVPFPSGAVSPSLAFLISETIS